MYAKFVLNTSKSSFLYIAAEWYKGDVKEIIDEATATGGDPNISDAFTLNGQPGYPNNCSVGKNFFPNLSWGKKFSKK